MARFHVCMPVAEDDGFRCFVCHRDMRADMSEYDREIDQQTKVAASGAGEPRAPRSGHLKGDTRDARLGLS